MITDEFRIGAILIIPTVAELIGLVVSILMDPYTRVRQRRLLLINTVLIFSLFAENLAGYYFERDSAFITYRTIMSVYGYCIRPVILVLFIQIVGTKYLSLAWSMVSANGIVYMTAFFSRIAFWFDPENSFRRGPLSYTCHIVSAILLLWLIVLTFKRYRSGGKQMMIPFFMALLIVGATVMDGAGFDKFQVSCLTIAVVHAALFFYIWLHLQFVREHEMDLMARQRIQLMVSQIQPHFLFNTLTTIQALCTIDPDRAADTTEKFASYLRQNLESLNEAGLIPFEKELEHTQIYTEIEKIRFQNIDVIFDTPEIEFQVPALTVQPLVENAIRHGVRIRKQGIVRVETRRILGAYEIIISDNGKGFDVEEMEKMGKNHVGLRNVRERVEKMADGTMTIESKIDEGTRITIRIPA